MNTSSSPSRIRLVAQVPAGSGTPAAAPVPAIRRFTLVRVLPQAGLRRAG